MRGGSIAWILGSCVVALCALTASAEACRSTPSIDRMIHASAERERAHVQAEKDASFVGTFVVVAIALGSLVVIAGPASDARRSLRRRRRRTPWTETSSLDARLVEQLARAWRARSIVTAIVAMAAAFAVVVTMRDPAPHLLLLVGPVVVFVRALSIVCRAQLVLGRVRDPALVTRYDGSRFIFVLAGDEIVGWLTAWPSTLEREVARGVPAATVRA